MDPAPLAGAAAEDCMASPEELLQLELAGYAHDLGHGPFSHLWERFLRSQPGDPQLAAWCHEDMSLKLLDLAVEDASKGLPEEHFLRQEHNISAVRNMIMGVTDGVVPEKTWLYTIVNNRQSGLDVDKMDYLCRDQLFTFAGEPGRFHSMAHIQELLDHARVVVVEGPVFTPQGRTPEPQLRTEIAFERTRDGTLIERVNDLFDTRSLMHEKVYQCGDVMALEESFLRLLQEVDPVFGWSGMVLDPHQFLRLDDSILDQLRVADTSAMTPQQQRRVAEGRRILHLMDTGRGARFIPEARCLPIEAIEGLRVPELKELVEREVMDAVRAEVGLGPQQLWAKVSDISEGRGGERAIGAVTFFTGAASGAPSATGTQLHDVPNWHMHQFNEERLRHVYGMRLGAHRSVRLCYCHVQYWWDGPVIEAQAAGIWALFDRKWQDWRRRVEAASAAPPAAAGVKRQRDCVEAEPIKTCEGGEVRLQTLVEEKIAGEVAGAGGARLSDTVPDSEDEEENRAVSCTNC